MFYDIHAYLSDPRVEGSTEVGVPLQPHHLTEPAYRWMRLAAAYQDVDIDDLWFLVRVEDLQGPPNNSVDMWTGWMDSDTADYYR